MGSSNEVLPVFDGSSFADWKIAVKNALREKALWRIVNKEIGEPQQIDKEKELWKCKLEQARGIIGKALSPNLNRRFVDIDNPIELWENLEKDYKDADIASMFSIEEKLMNLDPFDFEKDYFNEVNF